MGLARMKHRSPDKPITTSSRASGTRLVRPSVVLFDPDAKARRELAQLLRLRGWAIVECALPSQAIQVARSGRAIDALLVDVETGVAVADEVRRLRPDVRVLFTSNREASTPAAVGRPGADFRVVERLLRVAPHAASRRNAG
jgi:CheY-like chemotaxis protein